MKEEDEENKKVLAAKMHPIKKPKIISGKPRVQQINRRKKRYDELGNEINQNDKDIMNDIAQGRRVLYYKEDILTKHM